MRSSRHAEERRAEKRPPDASEEALPRPDAAPGARPPDLAEGAEAEPAAEADPEPASAEPAVDYKDRWLRAEAELQNLRRRSQRDLDETRRFAEDRALLELISLLDDLERAVEASNEAGAPGPWVEGVRLVANRARAVLARHGVTPIEAVGETFDPELHEAMLEVTASPDVPAGRVAQVIRKGYRRDGRALRAARVAVAGHGGAGTG